MEDNLILDYNLESYDSVYTNNQWPIFSHKREVELYDSEQPFSAISLQVRSNQNSTMLVSLKDLAVDFYANLFKSSSLNLDYSYFLYYQHRVNSRQLDKKYNIWNFYSNELIDNLSDKRDAIYNMDDYIMYTGIIRIEQKQLNLICNPKIRRGMLILSANLSVSSESLHELASSIASGILPFYKHRINGQNDLILKSINEYNHLNYTEMTFILSRNNLIKYFGSLYDAPE